jgi:hypothetical protein
MIKSKDKRIKLKNLKDIIGRVLILVWGETRKIRIINKVNKINNKKIRFLECQKHHFKL